MCGHINGESCDWLLIPSTDFLWGMSQMSHGWRENGGKDLELRALLRKVDVSGGAGAASV